MLETPEERIILLKAGITGQQIEELYISLNNIKVMGNQRPFKKIGITIPIFESIAFCQEA